MNELSKFEDIVKELSVVNISKNKERVKIVYDLEGIVYNNYYIPYLKVVFMLNENSFIVGNGNDYKNYEIAEDIFKFAKEDKFIKNYSNFVMNLNRFNEITDSPFAALTQIKKDTGVVPMEDKLLSFKLSKIDSEYGFAIKVNMRELFINGKIIKVNFDNIYKNVVDNI